MRNTVIIMIFLSSLGLWGETVLEYRVINEDGTTDNIVRFYDEGDELRFFSKGERGYVDIICSDDMNTIRYDMQSNEDSMALSAYRTEDSIVVVKTQDGKEETQVLEYEGNIPWYQTFHYQFSDFALSGEKKRKFLMIRPDNLSLSEWQVVYKGEETVQTPAGDIKAVRVKVSLGGILSAFWNAECWYRVSDGRFIQYVGPAGGPGSKTMTTVLKSEGQG